MRKGMMKGSGKRGYHNIIGKDPMVHSQSAKGIKQPQKWVVEDKLGRLWLFKSKGKPIYGIEADSNKKNKMTLNKVEEGKIIETMSSDNYDTEIYLCDDGNKYRVDRNRNSGSASFKKIGVKR
jgi:hypothetical protein